MKTDEKQDAINEASGLVGMYQSGFIDGWKYRNKEYVHKNISDKKLWARLQFFCHRAFEKRFGKAEKDEVKKA